MWLNGLASNGSVSSSLIDQAVTRIYRSAVLLGLLDPTPGQVYPFLNLSTVDSQAHRDLALRAARASLVLLKNEAKLLPLKKSAKVAFIGPHANSTQSLLSNYVGENKLVNFHSALQAAQQSTRGLSVSYARGCSICDKQPDGFPNMPCTQTGDKSGFAEALALARASDIAVVFIGSDQTVEAENFDRSTITLLGAQEDLALQIIAAQPNTVVVFISGSIVSSPALISAAPAVMQAYYPGQLGGDAIVDALFGEVSPSGRLPQTMYSNKCLCVSFVFLFFFFLYY